MLEGIANSKVFILFLSKDVFSGFILTEIGEAFRLGKRIILVDYSKTNMHGYWSFNDYVSTRPERFKAVFEIRSVHFYLDSGHLELAIGDLMAEIENKMVRIGFINFGNSDYISSVLQCCLQHLG